MRSPKTRPSEEEVDLAAARARAKLQSLKYNWAQDLLEGLWIARKLVLCILAVLLGIGVWLAQHEGHLTEFAWLWPQTTAMMGAVKHHLKAAGAQPSAWPGASWWMRNHKVFAVGVSLDSRQKAE
ncbi:unnamed protein product [Effrenium voratum]|nr:unnamed protein product [Effrenium voratum]